MKDCRSYEFCFCLLLARKKPFKKPLKLVATSQAIIESQNQTRYCFSLGLNRNENEQHFCLLNEVHVF